MLISKMKFVKVAIITNKSHVITVMIMIIKVVTNTMIIDHENVDLNDEVR